jgi:hypothetical protein
VEPELHVYPHKRYLPAVIRVPGTVKSSLRKVVIALRDAPEHACGAAFRVGYTGSLETDLAIYRLKIKPSFGKPLVTLPGLFVLEEGLFREYEQ